MTLTETVFWTKAASKFVGVFVVLIIVGYYAYLYVISITRTPDQVFRADFRCGELPKVEIEAQESTEFGNASIQVVALGPSLPNDRVPLITYVYKIDVKGETFETRDLAYSLARDFNIRTDVQHAAGSTIYQWKDPAKRSTLTVNTDTLHFSYIREDAVLPAVPNLQLPATVFRAPEYAGNYLRALGLYTNDFAKGKSFAYPVTMVNGQPVLAKSLDVAQLIRVDFQKVNYSLVYDRAVLSPTFDAARGIDFVGFIDLMKKKGEDNPAYIKFESRRVSRTPETANVQIYIRSQGGHPSDGIQQLHYNNWKVEEVPCGTYPIIRPADAISKISQGEGTIVYAIEKGGDPLQPRTSAPLKEINLYNLELAYYEPNRIQPYLQPIYVASGEVVFENGARGDIALYVPAIDYDARPTTR
ncbi:MAG: hypothetical protein QY312_03900 [Candidatus Dojkabacteria bacterium]|nr:MAG: hypothetical protein QY312_03900 [Candidatus Dojkabacteria bacterium]